MIHYSLISFQEPIRLESSAVDGCCFLRRGNVEVFVRLARNAYVPGESVLLDIDVHNSTDGRGHLSVDLVQVSGWSPVDPLDH